MDLTLTQYESDNSSKNLKLFDSVLNDSYDMFIQKLFENSSLMDITNNNGESLLHYCSLFGMIDKYYALINMGALIQKTNEKNTLLHYASISGKDSFLIVELVKSGISPVEANTSLQTSLHMCANEKIALYLNLWCTRNKINVADLIDNEGNNVAHGCKMAGHVEAALFWIKNYPQLDLQLNHYGKTWKEVKKKYHHFCTESLKAD